MFENRSDVVQSAAADNATATATVVAPKGSRVAITGLMAHYSADVDAHKIVTVKFGTTSKMVIDWDFVNGPLFLSFPSPVNNQEVGENVSAELAASGAGGTTGQVALFYVLL